MTAIQSCNGTGFSDVGRKTLAMVNAVDLLPAALLANNLSNELDLIEQPFILVLDDIHLIKDESVLELLTQLLLHPPPALHLVLIGRRDPFLPIPALRAKSQLTEVRTQDLRFNKMEIGALLNQMLPIQVDSSTVDILEKKTEGWVTGLHLATLSMRHRGGKIHPSLLEPEVDAQYVMEYLFTEVLSHQPPGPKNYLVNTAILDRFCGPLCEAVCAPNIESFTCENSGWEFINWLKKENMFLIPLDAENRWFRYHKIFQKLLANQLKRHRSADEIKFLHAKASTWLSENGLIEESLRHSLAADDIPGAMKIITRSGHILMNEQQWPRLERWLHMLPHDCIEQDPELLMFQAWLYHTRQQWTKMGICLEKFETLISGLTPDAADKLAQIQGHFDALISFQYILQVDGKSALMHSKRACGRISREHRRARAFAHLFQAGASHLLGNMKIGISTLSQAASDQVTYGDPYHAHYLISPCFLYWMAGDLTAVQQAANSSMTIQKDRQLPETICYGLYFQGIVNYQRNELKIAKDKLVTATDKSYLYNGVNYAHSAFTLALLHLAMGDPSEAEDVSESVVSYALETNNSTLLKVARGFLAELALRQGRLAEAAHWAEHFVAKPFVMMYRSYVPQLTLVKVLLAQGTTSSLEQAAELLKQLYDFVTYSHNKRFLIEVLALQALLHDTRDETSAALERLTEALHLAEPAGFIRLFVDLGPQMANLLKQLIKQNIAVDYIGRILTAFGEDEKRAMKGKSGHPAAHPPPFGTQPLVEPLSNREYEILNLLAQQLRNKEIAAKLFISSETVKKHLGNVYGKLNVKGRRQAVEKARLLNII